jgi:hypothetical protein
MKSTSRWRLEYAPVAFALPLIVALSSEKVAVPPLAWVAVLTVLVFGAWTALGRERSPVIDLALSGLLGVAATHLLFAPGFPAGHDSIPHVWGTYGFLQSIDAGNLAPRWIHHIGLGIPLLLFYPPLPFYAMLPLHALDLPAYEVLKGGFILFNALSGMSMFTIVKRWTGDPRAALIAAGAYCFAPYHLLESHYRVALAESAAMAVLPPVFYFAHRAMVTPARKELAAAAAWMAVLTLTHPLSLSMSCIALGVWACATNVLRARRIVTALCALAAAALLGVAIAGYYTVPIAAEGRYTTISDTLGAAKPSYTTHGLAWKQWFERREWSGLEKSERHEDSAGRRDMPFYFGVSLVALAPLGLVRRRRAVPTTSSSTRPGETPAGKRDSDPAAESEPFELRVVPWGLFAITAASLVLTLAPLDEKLGWLPPLKMLQFPWRFLEIATFGASALAGFACLRALQATGRHRWSVAVPGLLLALIVFDAFPYLGAPAWHAPYRGLGQLADVLAPGAAPPLRVDQVAYPPANQVLDVSLLRYAYPEYITVRARKAFVRLRPRDEETAALQSACVGITERDGPEKAEVLQPEPYAEFAPEDGSPLQALAFRRGGERITVVLPETPGTLTVKEMWFPGWEGRRFGRPVAVLETPEGVMRVQVDGGGGTLELSFSRTRWDRLAGALLSMVVIAALWWPRGPTVR